MVATTAAGVDAHRSITLGLGAAVLQRAVAVAALGWATRGADAAAADGSMFAAVLVGVALTIPVVLALARLGRTNLRDLGWRTDAPLRHVVVGVAGGVFLVLATAGLVGIVAPGGVESLLSAVVSWTPRQRLLFVIIGIGAAFSEETIFRGWLQRALAERMGTWPGLLLCALIFAAMHLAFRPAALAVKLIFGVVLGALALRTRSLVPSAVAHAVAWSLLGFA
jgi:membrane protease YdiL (CAAX protease family)